MIPNEFNDSMDAIKADGEVFAFLPETAIQSQYLKTFPFEKREQKISISTEEFSAVCPFSGLPDVARVDVEYYPDGDRCVELKSFKYYMISFRNVGIYQEAVTKRIYEDLKAIICTARILVRTTYNTRGGFDVSCEEGTLLK